MLQMDTITNAFRTEGIIIPHTYICPEVGESDVETPRKKPSSIICNWITLTYIKIPIFNRALNIKIIISSPSIPQYRSV